MARSLFPLVTIYMVNHNYGNYIEKAIKSVLRQSYKNFELIIIDDGSNDESREILRKFEKNKKVKIILQNKKGLNVSNNIAIRSARGKYISRLDSDDWLDENFIEIMLNKLEKKSKAVIAICDYFLTNNYGEIISHYRNFNQKNVKLKNIPAHGACSLIKLDFLKEIGGYREIFDCQDGFDLWTRILNERKQIISINLPLFYYRQHASSLTKNKNKILQTKSQILEKSLQKKDFRKITAVIPIRGPEYDKDENSFLKIKNQYLIDMTLKKVEDLKHKSLINKIYILTSSKKIINHIKKNYDLKIYFLERKLELIRENISLDNTIEFFKKKISAKYVMLVNIDFPLRTNFDFENAIYNFLYYKPLKLITTKTENGNFFIHNGKSLKEIKKNSGLRLEREEIYKFMGGITIYNNSNKQYSFIANSPISESGSIEIKKHSMIKNLLKV